MENVKYTNAQIVSAIKRLNDRFKQFERKGYTESRQYNTLLGGKWSDDYGRTQQGVFYNWTQLGTTKSGYTKLSTSVKSYTPQQINQIMKYGKIGSKTTVGVARKNAIDELKNRGIKKPNESQIKVYLSQMNELHRFITTHTAEIYKVQHLSDAVHRSTKLTQEEADEILNIMYNPEYLDEFGQFVGDSE